MNDVSEALAKKHNPIVRPRDAASLILLRGKGKDLEVLAGRRSLEARFMPGVYVFPGGAIDPADRSAWCVEAGSETLAARLVPPARAALRETWEEVGLLLGRPGASPPPARPRPIEGAYRGRGLVAAMDLLTYVGRAITPSHSFRRFNTRFFLADGDDVSDAPQSGAELEDVGWHPVGRAAARIVPRRDPLHAGARHRPAQRRRRRRAAALLLGQECPPHRHLPGSAVLARAQAACGPPSICASLRPSCWSVKGLGSRSTPASRTP